MNKKTTFPILYHKTSKGAINIWSVWAEGDTVFTEWGQKNGKMQLSNKKVEQKNIGKKNETSLEEQAIFEAKSLWTHKKERKYVETLQETQETIFLPMLAEKFSDRNRFIKNENYPIYGQPKYDGLRCIAYWVDDKIQLMSRGGKTYFLNHISNELEKHLPKNMFLDGELYIHGTTLQTINKLVRPTKNFNPDSNKIEYHVYDCGTIKNADKLTWIDRMNLLNEFFNKKTLQKIKKVESKIINSEKEVYLFESECVSKGFEGAILSLPNGCYKFGYRSSDLLKVKSFQDDEFEIIGFTNGIGKFENCIIYICKTKEGKEFNVVPKGSFEDRNIWLKQGKKHIGKMLKVKFFSWTEDKVPQFPVGICIRLEEDM